MGAAAPPPPPLLYGNYVILQNARDSDKIDIKKYINTCVQTLLMLPKWVFQLNTITNLNLN